NVARPATVTRLRAPGPIDPVTASVDRLRVALPYATAICARYCSWRPWMNGNSSEYSSSACPSPATLPCPKMPSAAGISRRRSPSATLYWAARNLTTACAVVSRTVFPEVVIIVGLLQDSPRTAVDDDGLFFGHFVDSRADTLLADTAALQSAVGHQVGPPQRRPIDMDVARIDLAHRAYRRRHVGGENPCPQAVFAVIG